MFTGPADPQYCGEGAAPQACRDWLGTLGLRQDLIYQPDSNFWPLQWAEAGSFVGVAALLAGFCFWCCADASADRRTVSTACGTGWALAVVAGVLSVTAGTIQAFVGAPIGYPGS